MARADRVTVAVTLFALLELYKQGELTWAQDEPFGEITIESAAARSDDPPDSMTIGLEQTLESLLFLSAEPVEPTALADATGAELHEVVTRARAAARALRVRAPRAGPARARRRLGAQQPPRRRARRAAAAGPPADAAADAGAGRDAGNRRLPAAGLAAGDRPDPRRERRIGGLDAARAGRDRGGWPLAVRGRAVPDDGAVPAPVRPELARGAARDHAAFDPSPELEEELRERLLAGRRSSASTRAQARPAPRAGHTQRRSRGPRVRRTVASRPRRSSLRPERLDRLRARPSIWRGRSGCTGSG